MGISDNKPKSSEEIEKFKQQYSEYSLEEIGDIYGVSKRCIIRWAKELKLGAKPKITQNSNLPIELRNPMKMVREYLGDLKVEDHPDIQKVFTDIEVLIQKDAPKREIKDMAMKLIGLSITKAKNFGDMNNGLAGYLKLYMDDKKVDLIEKNKEKELDEQFLISLKKRLMTDFFAEVEVYAYPEEFVVFKKILSDSALRKMEKKIKEMNIPRIIDVDTPADEAREILIEQGKLNEDEYMPGEIMTWEEIRKMTEKQDNDEFIPGR